MALWLWWWFEFKEEVGGRKCHFPKVDSDKSSVFDTPPSKPPLAAVVLAGNALESSLHSLHDNRQVTLSMLFCSFFNCFHGENRASCGLRPNYWHIYSHHWGFFYQLGSSAPWHVCACHASHWCLEGSFGPPAVPSQRWFCSWSVSLWRRGSRILKPRKEMHFECRELVLGSGRFCKWSADDPNGKSCKCLQLAWLAKLCRHPGPQALPSAVSVLRTRTNPSSSRCSFSTSSSQRLPVYSVEMLSQITVYSACKKKKMPLCSECSCRAAAVLHTLWV